MSPPSQDTPPKRFSRRALVAAAVAAVLVIGGGTAIAVAATSQKSAPQPPAAAQTPAPTTSAAPSPGRSTPAPSTAHATGHQPTFTTRGPLLPRAAPTALSIPAINVHSSLLQLGINADHSVQVPPLERDSRAGWYKYSPTPGQLGPAILLGHIDSAKYGPGIFFELGKLKPGDPVSVTRADGTVAVFRIDKVAEYPKSTFPTLEVYGNIDHAGLRLITCGGKFDFSSHNYEDNIVAYASLVSSHRG